MDGATFWTVFPSIGAMHQFARSYGFAPTRIDGDPAIRGHRLRIRTNEMERAAVFPYVPFCGIRKRHWPVPIIELLPLSTTATARLRNAGESNRVSMAAAIRSPASDESALHKTHMQMADRSAISRLCLKRDPRCTPFAAKESWRPVSGWRVEQADHSGSAAIKVHPHSLVVDAAFKPITPRRCSPEGVRLRAVTCLFVVVLGESD